ncbi:MAG: phosphomannose isomerase type II C-terminal cupin domain [Betaproteobacteria bacterium]|jgi:mannose-6-phosphate isomerase
MDDPLARAPSTPPARTIRPWGWFENLSDLPGARVKRIRVEPGHQLSLQKHRQRAEHWVVTLGVARVTVGQETRDLAVGAHVDIPVGTVHRLENPGTRPAEIIEVQFGAYLGEDDIERLEDRYDRA